MRVIASVDQASRLTIEEAGAATEPPLRRCPGLVAGAAA